MTLVLALGGDEDSRWIHLPDLALRARWPDLVDPGVRVDIASLHATSPLGQLIHPGEVPLGSPATVGDILATVDGELGNEACLHEIRLMLPGGLILFSAEGHGVRLEARDDARFAPVLGRLTGDAVARWRSVLEAVRAEFLTGLYLSITAAADAVTVTPHDSLDQLRRGISGESLRIAI